MPSLTWIDPFEERKNPNSQYKFDAEPEAISSNVREPDAIALWNDVMKRLREKQTNKIVLQRADTATQVLTRKIIDFLNDEDHLQTKFNGIRPFYETIYKGAGISKATWNRLLAGGNSNISRAMVFALAIGLRLSDKQTVELLYSAGFCLNYELDLDVAMMYFIKREIYDMREIKRILGAFSDVRNGLDRFYFQPPQNVE